MEKLTPRQKKFTEEYLIDLNATKAALRAGYSAKTSDKIGYQLLEKTRVKEALERAIRKREQRTEITQDMVVAQLAKIAFADIRGIVTWENGELRMRPSDDVDGTTIAEVTQTAVKLNDRMKALELLGKHLGMFKDKMDVSINGRVVFVDDLHDPQD